MCTFFWFFSSPLVTLRFSPLFFEWIAMDSHCMMIFVVLCWDLYIYLGVFFLVRYTATPLCFFFHVSLLYARSCASLLHIVSNETRSDEGVRQYVGFFSVSSLPPLLSFSLFNRVLRAAAIPIRAHERRKEQSNNTA